ncbi:MAG: lactonase family protein [Candidatus Bathyarchaeia archaeon]
MSKELMVYVGTYTLPILFGTGEVLAGKGEGIYVFRADQDSGALEFSSKISGVANPSYLSFDPKHYFLYAVNELKNFEGKPTGAVSAFSMDSETGGLRFLNIKPTMGTDPCHVTVDRTGRFVLVANYMSGSVCVLPIRKDGSLEDACDFIQHRGSSVNPKRQEGPHAHACALDNDNRHVLVPDLGIDKIMVYKFDSNSGKLEPNDEPWFQVRAGDGPRQLAFHPNGRYAYLINELSSTLTVFSYNKNNGTLKEIQTVSTLPVDFANANTGADIHVHPSGRFVYASNRGLNDIVIYAINEDTGKLTYVGRRATQGKTPRNFAIDPTGRFLFVANQDTDTIVTFRIDQQTGELSLTGHVTKVPTPVCIKMILL